MQPKMKALQSSLVSIAVVGAAGSCAAPASTKTVNQRISAGTTLDSALRQLARSGTCIVATDLTVSDLRIGSDIPSGDFSKVVARLADEFGVTFSYVGRVLLLQRRFVRAEEDHNLEFEEFAATASDINRVLASIDLGPTGERYVVGQNSFYGSLKPEQIAAARSTGLPVSGLTHQQRASWSGLTRSHAYHLAASSYSCAAKAFDAWGRTRVRKVGAKLLYLSPDSDSPKGERTTVLGTPLPANSSSRPPVALSQGGKAAASTEVAPEIPDQPIPDSFRKPTGALDGVLTAQQIAGLLQKASGVPVTIPSYAKSRRLAVFASESRGDELVAITSGMWGWELHQSRGKRYSLGRATAGQVSSPMDVHARIKRALPPPLKRMWSRDADQTIEPRISHRLAVVARSIEGRVGKGWSEVAVSDLSSDAQRLLSACIADRMLRPWSLRYVRTAQPPAWLSAPETGRFVLKSSDPNDPHPLFEFVVSGRGKGFDGWGWKVGTSSLEKM